MLDDQTRPFHPVQPQVVVAEVQGNRELQQHLLSEADSSLNGMPESTNADPLLQPAVEVIRLLTQQTVKAIERVEQGASREEAISSLREAVTSAIASLL